ncbi:MAG: hypothetical protein IPL26_23870 [Leptospiraceae bacterium]|nr:hypothetical protein [Leptospiraceae bacterium]
MKHKINSVIIILVIIGSNLYSDSYQKHLDTNIFQNSGKVCSTEGFSDTNTAFTFFGDSRVDLVSVPLYGASSLDFYLGTGGQWNTQNFAVSATTSVDLLAQTNICFAREADPTLPKYPNFKIAYNVAFEQGGNDFIKATVLLIINPFFYISLVPQVRADMMSVIYTLQMRERNVLLIGNYPAVAWCLSSAKNGFFNTQK